MAEGDRHKPHRVKVNKSGYVFQLAVEEEVRRTVDAHGWRIVESEMPAGEGYLDILLQFHDQIFAAIECKAASEPWIFLMPERSNAEAYRCRLEWYNGRAHDLSAVYVGGGPDRVFCDEFTMELPSPEAKFAVSKHKNSTVPSLETVSSTLLSQSHSFLADEDRARDGGFELMVPIIVTSAPLLTCSFSVTQKQLRDGLLEEDTGSFRDVPFVRFRKSLATIPSDWYSPHPLSAEDMYADSTRTVFVAQAHAFVSLLSGLASLRHQTGTYPPRYTDPPRTKGRWLA